MSLFSRFIMYICFILKMRDSIDFASMSVGRLFRKLFFPTLMGMVFSALFIITDGIFVGKGIGSDAMAAVNITAPIFLVNTGIALMFGIGASVVASIHLSQGKFKVARINITQSVMASSLIILTGIVLIWFNYEAVANILGASERLLPLAVEYMKWFVPFLIFSAILSSGLFYLRLDGSPNYAMVCNIVAAVMNMFLDYLFIYRLQWGMFGAALATSLGYVVGAIMVLLYLLDSTHTLYLVRFKTTKKSIQLTLRNVVYMCRMGSSTFMCQLAVATMMFTGNYVFMNYLHEDGVAAFSVACYLYPLVLMVYNAIAQSMQPILSYNYGAGYPERVRAAFLISLVTAIVCGIVVFVLSLFFTPWVVSLFLQEGLPSNMIASEGLSYFASGFVFFGINMVAVGYFQSVERDMPAMVITILRGLVFIILSFLLLPRVLGVPGIWLAVPVAELLTFLFVLLMYLRGIERKALAE